MPEIKLSNGLVPFVDEISLLLIERYKWFPLRSSRTTYAQANGPTVNGKQPTIRMHRLILGAKPSNFVDHRNGDGLDNRRENLRLATRDQNNQNARCRRDNTTGYKGVTLTPQNRYRSDIHAGGRRALLGHYATAEEAAHAYNLIAQIAHGQYAQLNTVTADVALIDTRVRAVLRERASQLAEFVQDPRIVAELLGGAGVRDLRKAS